MMFRCFHWRRSFKTLKNIFGRNIGRKGYIHNIYSLRLGYVCYLSDEETEGFVAYPMWRVECDYIKPGGVGYEVNAMSDDYRNGFDFTDLYVNAQNRRSNNG